MDNCNCRDAMDRLYQYIDRELTEEEQRVVQKHLDHCPPCRDLFQFEENILTTIRTRCRQTEAPSDLRDRIQKLRHA